MLRSIREQRGFSLEEFAERTGIGREELAQLEAGTYVPPLGQLIKLNKALSLRMADVISPGEEPHRQIGSSADFFQIWKSERDQLRIRIRISRCQKEEPRDGALHDHIPPFRSR